MHRSMSLFVVLGLFATCARVLPNLSVRKSYVEFEDGDKGLIPNGWIHKVLSHTPASNGNESNLSNNA